MASKPSSEEGPPTKDKPPAMDDDTAAGKDAAAGTKDGSAEADPTGPVRHMQDLLLLSHRVFVSHGFKAQQTDDGKAAAAQRGSFRVPYTSESGLKIVVTFVTVQQHLIVYAMLTENPDVFYRAKVQLGMAPVSVQAKLDYLVVHPLVHRSRVPTLVNMGNPILFSILGCLRLPAIAAMGATSQPIASASVHSDYLWWEVLQAMPKSDELKVAINSVVDVQQKGQPVDPGTFKQMVKDEVVRAREEAQAKRKEQERRKREQEELEEERRRRSMGHNPLMVGPPRRPRPGMFGGPEDMYGVGPHNPMVLGGERDLMPGGLMMPGGRPGRSPGFGPGGPGGLGGPFGPGGGGFGPGRGGFGGGFGGPGFC